jgi:hypothetical protein
VARPALQSGSRKVEPRKRKITPSDLRRQAQRIEARIEDASYERRQARAEARAADAHTLDVELLGPDAGEGPNSRIGRGRARKGRFDPYTQVRIDGLYHERRKNDARVNSSDAGKVSDDSARYRA